MRPPVFEFNTRFSRTPLLNEYQRLRKLHPAGANYKYSAGSRAGQSENPVSVLWAYNFMDIEEFQNGRVVAEIKDHLKWLDIPESPVFTFLAIRGGSTLGWHKDDALCSINVLLTESEAMVEYEDGAWKYSEALLDVSRKHRVVNTGEERVLFRLSFRRHGFEQLVSILGRRLNGAGLSH